MTSNHKRMLQLADDFFNLAKTESDGFHFGGLVALRSVASILEDDDLQSHINQLLNLLKSKE